MTLPLAWVKTPPSEPGHYDVRGSTVIRNGCSTVTRDSDGTMWIRSERYDPVSDSHPWQITSYGGPYDTRVHWGETEFRGPIPTPWACLLASSEESKA